MIWRKFSGLKLTCRNIKIKDDLQELKIIDEVFISTYFKKIYDKINGGGNAKPLFYLHIDNIDIDAIYKMYQSIYNRENTVRDNSMILANIVKFLNKKNINNFKVTINFKNFKLPNKFGNIEINKASFKNTSLNKDYIGELKLKYKLDGKDGILQGLFLKDKLDHHNKISKLFSDWRSYDSVNIILELYGYTNSTITNGTNIFHPKGFYKMLLTYDISNKDLGFENELRQASIKVSDIPLIEGENLKFSGRYHFINKTLFVKDFNIHINKIPISGSFTIDSHGHFEGNARSNHIINKDIIFSLWPISNRLQKEFLQSLVTDSMVSNPSFVMKAYKQADQKYRVYNLKLQFDLEKITLNQYIKGYNYKIYSDQANVQINIDDIKIKSNL